MFCSKEILLEQVLVKFVDFRKASHIYIYKRLRPRKKIRNRKKKEQQKLFINDIEHQTS